MIITDMPHVTTKNQIVDALGYTPVGGQGVNLLTGTRDFSGEWVSLKEWKKENETYKGMSVYSKNSRYSGIYQKIPIKAGEKYTFSCFVKTSVNTQIGIGYDNNAEGIAYCTPIANPVNSDTEWKRVSQVFDVKSDGYGTFKVELRSEFSQEGATLYVCGYKLERGTVTDPVWTPAPEDVVTKTPYDIFEALDGISEMHRNLYRGRNLGESTQMSEAHKAAIQDGSFKDLFVGDYWTHEGINYRIADMDYWLRCGDTDFNTHHLVIVPDSCLGENKPMNESGKTEGGYHGSEMYTTTLPSIKTTYIDKAFPSLVLTHKEYLTNAVTEGHPSGGGWFESTVELMNEIMVYGCPVFMPMNDGSTIPTNYTIGNSQLALFRLNPRMIKTRYNYWLRDVVSASNFAYVINSGNAGSYGASNTDIGVRPYFCIGVQPSGDEADDDMEVVTADSGRMDGREPDATKNAEREPDTTKEKMQEV